MPNHKMGPDQGFKAPFSGLAG